MKSALQELYSLNNLLTVEDRINYLKRIMKIRAVISEDEETLEEILAGLEESYNFGFWRAK